MYFENENHLNAFKASPLKYAPQFGGHCSFAVSTGFCAPTDPKLFEIVDDKLYFLSNEEVMNDWNENKTTIIKDAKSNWK